MGSLTATDYSYRPSNDAHARYRSESQWPVDGSPTDELMKAALGGRYDEVRRLLTSGESPNVADRDGNTSLHYLVRGFHKLLDRAAPSPGLLSGDRGVGTSQEFEGRISGFNACLSLLLSYGAMVTPNLKGDTATQMASARLADYISDPFNAAAGTHKEWTKFVDSLMAA
ncbi:hypothetical protein AA313_de0208267 [Arthrobotrys entomopaga]|nr:hypothetical protein AA313_de0208267 [Arthrobotrys entomopaga]